MITPIRAMRIDDILKRKDDLLVSVDDIMDMAKCEREGAINELLAAARNECMKEDKIHFTELYIIADKIREKR